MSIIVTEGLAKRYGPKTALYPLSLTVGEGECLGLLGHNGAGKSTTLKLLLGLLRPSAGRALIMGYPAGHLKVRGRVGYSPETPPFYPYLTAQETLRFYGRLAGLPAAKLDVDGLLARVGLKGAARSKVGGFSKGMVQRLGVAFALLHDPPILLLDEPTAGLDAMGRLEIRRLVRELKAAGKTILLNSHILPDVEEVADKVAILQGGRLVAFDDLNQPEMVGVEARVTNLDPDLLEQLRRQGMAVSYEQESLRLGGLAEEEHPALLARLVASGARVHSFVPQRRNLEERLLAVMEGGK